MKHTKSASIFLLPFLLLCQSIASHVKTPSSLFIISHLHLLQELKARFGMSTVGSLLKSTEKTLTQTEAYLQVYKEDVKNTFDTDLDIHKALIDTIISKEREFSNSHYVFYHAHDRAFIILQDFMKLLHEYLRIIKVNDFSPLRLKNVHVIDGPHNAQEYLEAHSDIHDHDEKTRSHMACVNLSLFGNHENFGECTFHYFISNKSVSSASLSDRLKPIFSYYGFNTSYIAQLTRLTSYLKSSTGNLLQIFIPHDMVNSLLYLSHPMGRPYETITLHRKEYNCSEQSMQSLLHYMCTKPHRIQDLSAWQARLLFFDPLLDMDPAIKVFRYNAVSDNNMRRYQQKLRAIVANIVIDYIKTANYLQHQEPLMRLYRYMNA